MSRGAAVSGDDGGVDGLLDGDDVAAHRGWGGHELAPVELEHDAPAPRAFQVPRLLERPHGDHLLGEHAGVAEGEQRRARDHAFPLVHHLNLEHRRRIEALKLEGLIEGWVAPAGDDGAMGRAANRELDARAHAFRFDALDHVELFAADAANFERAENLVALPLLGSAGAAPTDVHVHPLERDAHLGRGRRLRRLFVLSERASEGGG
mmetsp:Transcript_20955/g.67805  ORF Transcript_20955/g.67805 Transcript_20955/m.67805 type:complete len:207 (-) Transcript_20955:242-862(-)